MIILLDVDLILELLLPRVGLAEMVDQRYRQFWEVLRNPQIEAYITENGFVKISDFLRRRNNSDASVVICEIQDIFTICPVDNGILERACAFHQIIDLESAIEIVCALEMEASTIVSHHPQNFAEANFQILSVEGFLNRLRINFSFQLVSLSNWLINTFEPNWEPPVEISNYRSLIDNLIYNQPDNSVTSTGRRK